MPPSIMGRLITKPIKTWLGQKKTELTLTSSEEHRELAQTKTQLNSLETPFVITGIEPLVQKSRRM